MGLTGIIWRGRPATPVQTSGSGGHRPHPDIDETMAYLSATDDRYGYTVAWTDCLARGTSLGRSVITSGDFAAPGDLGPKDRRDPLAFRPGARIGAPRGFPSGLLNPVTVGLANEAWFRKAPRRREGEIQTIGAFFHPLDGIRNWNRVYGPAGFRQYQFVVPLGQEGVVRRAQTDQRRAGYLVRAVLKQFGPADPGFLSFRCRAGRWRWFPGGHAGPRRAAGPADEVLDSGSRVYLAKDSGAARGFAGMYPRLEEFRTRWSWTPAACSPPTSPPPGIAGSAARRSGRRYRVRMKSSGSRGASGTGAAGWPAPTAPIGSQPSGEPSVARSHRQNMVLDTQHGRSSAASATRGFWTAAPPPPRTSRSRRRAARPGRRGPRRRPGTAR
jgi:hypothetical protein